MRGVVGTIALVLLGVMGFAPSALGCSCIDSGPACQAFWKTDAVFDATVLRVEPASRLETFQSGQSIRITEKTVTLDVRESLKGVEKGPLDVFTSGEGASCGYDFKPGGRYLVFAYRRPSDGRLMVSLCSATREFNGTGDAADFVASLAAPARGGRVFGKVTTFLRQFNPDRSTSESATETRVRLVGGGQERSTLSSGGRYEFTGLAEGQYRIELELPEGYTTYSANRQIQIPSPRACAQENYSLSPAGFIAGRIVGSNNRGLARIQVEVTDPDARMHPIYGLPIESSTTDGDGYFEIDRLPPGRYIVGVNLKDLPNQYNPYARTLFPGGGLDPRIVTLILGQGVDLGNWELPPPPAVFKVPGMVTWKDGTPARGIYVSAWDQTSDPVERARGAGGATSAADGRFAIDLREGRSYTFVARDSGSSPLPVAGPRIEVGSTPPPAFVIVIQRDPPRH